jgi:hypothetical protein
MASDGVRQRCCTRCNTIQDLQPTEAARPCVLCGGTNFEGRQDFILTDSDKTFLKVQRILVDA